MNRRDSAVVIVVPAICAVLMLVAILAQWHATVPSIEARRAKCVALRQELSSLPQHSREVIDSWIKGNCR